MPTKRRYRKWTPEEEETLRQLFNDPGRPPIRKIARDMDRSPAAIRAKLDELGLSRSTRTNKLHIIAVVSSKGGVGKTTVSTGIAQGLARMGYKVGYMDLDIDNPCGHVIAGAQRPGIGAESLEPVEVNGVLSYSLGASLDEGVVLTLGEQRKWEVMAEMFTSIEWGDVNVMVLDFPPGVPPEFRFFTRDQVRPTGAVIVSQPQRTSIQAVKRTITLLYDLDIPLIGAVENMAGDMFGRGGVEELSRVTGVNALGTIDMDQSVREAGDIGEMMPEKQFQPIVKGVHEWIADHHS